MPKIKKYKCYHPYCEYIASSSSNLKNHRKIHVNDRPYKCPYCDHTAKQKIHITRHVKRIHPVDKVEKKYNCDKCSYSTNEYTHLENHYKKIHTSLPIQQYPRDLDFFDIDFKFEEGDELFDFEEGGELTDFNLEEGGELTDFNVEEGGELFNPDNTDISTVFEDKKDAGIIYKRRSRRRSKVRKSKSRRRSKVQKSKSRRRSKVQKSKSRRRRSSRR